MYLLLYDFLVTLKSLFWIPFQALCQFSQFIIEILLCFLWRIILSFLFTFSMFYIYFCLSGITLPNVPPNHCSWASTVSGCSEVCPVWDQEAPANRNQGDIQVVFVICSLQSTEVRGWSSWLEWSLPSSFSVTDHLGWALSSLIPNSLLCPNKQEYMYSVVCVCVCPFTAGAGPSSETLSYIRPHGWVQCSWLLPGSALPVAAIWGVNPWLELFLQLCLSNKSVHR